MFEWLLEFPERLTIPLDDWVQSIFDWLVQNWSGFFDAVDNVIRRLLLGIENFIVFDIEHFTPDFPWPLLTAIILVGLVAGLATRKWWAGIASALFVALIGSFFVPFSLPWSVVVLLVGVATWRIMRNWRTGLMLAGMLALIGTFGLWDLSMMTMAIIITSVTISLVMGIPTGIFMARSDRFESILKPQLDAMQTMPSFVYLIPMLMLFGMGKVPAVLATVIYAVPPVIRLTNVGIRQVSQNVIEAAKASGSSPLQILFNVQLPLAIPSIIVGINQTTMMALAMVVIASMIGARGVGLEVLLAIGRIEVGRGFQAGLCIVILAIIIDRITGAIAARQQRTLKT